MPQVKRNLEAKVVPSLDEAKEDPQHTNLYDDPWEFEGAQFLVERREKRGRERLMDHPPKNNEGILKTS